MKNTKQNKLVSLDDWTHIMDEFDIILKSEVDQIVHNYLKKDHINSFDIMDLMFSDEQVENIWHQLNYEIQECTDFIQQFNEDITSRLKKIAKECTLRFNKILEQYNNQTTKVGKLHYYKADTNLLTCFINNTREELTKDTTMSFDDYGSLVNAIAKKSTAMGLKALFATLMSFGVIDSSSDYGKTKALVLKDIKNYFANMIFIAASFNLNGVIALYASADGGKNCALIAQKFGKLDLISDSGSYLSNDSDDKFDDLTDEQKNVLDAVKMSLNVIEKLSTSYSAPDTVKKEFEKYKDITSQNDFSPLILSAILTTNIVSKVYYIIFQFSQNDEDSDETIRTMNGIIEESKEVVEYMMSQLLSASGINDINILREHSMDVNYMKKLLHKFNVLRDDIEYRLDIERDVHRRVFFFLDNVGIDWFCENAYKLCNILIDSESVPSNYGIDDILGGLYFILLGIAARDSSYFNVVTGKTKKIMNQTESFDKFIVNMVKVFKSF